MYKLLKGLTEEEIAEFWEEMDGLIDMTMQIL